MVFSKQIVIVNLLQGSFEEGMDDFNQPKLIGLGQSFCHLLESITY